MHVLQRIAVQADDKDHAFRSVKDYLETQMGDEYNYSSWYDWFVTGGGRWNPNEGSQYDDNDQSMTIAYAEEPEKFVSSINKAIESRIAEFNSYRQSFNDKGVDINAKLDSYDGNMDYSFELYDLYKMIDMMNGKWDYNSYFYDMTHESTNPKHMLDKVDDSWYLVFVDFHF